MPMIARKGRAHQQSVTGRPELSAPPTSAAEVAPIAEAYVLLVDHYAVPLDPAPLVAAGEAGMAAALDWSRGVSARGLN